MRRATIRSSAPAEFDSDWHVDSSVVFLAELRGLSLRLSWQFLCLSVLLLSVPGCATTGLFAQRLVLHGAEAEVPGALGALEEPGTTRCRVESAAGSASPARLHPPSLGREFELLGGEQDGQRSSERTVEIRHFLRVDENAPGSPLLDWDLQFGRHRVPFAFPARVDASTCATTSDDERSEGAFSCLEPTADSAPVRWYLTLSTPFSRQVRGVWSTSDPRRPDGTLLMATRYHPRLRIRALIVNQVDPRGPATEFHHRTPASSTVHYDGLGRIDTVVGRFSDGTVREIRTVWRVPAVLWRLEFGATNTLQRIDLRTGDASVAAVSDLVLYGAGAVDPVRLVCERDGGTSEFRVPRRIVRRLFPYDHPPGPIPGPIREE